MKTLTLIALLAAALAVVIGAPAHSAPLTVGTLVVERIGDGSTTLSNASFPISVLEVTTSGSLAQTITLAASGTAPQTDSGSATSNGYLNTFVSGTVGYLSVPGLNLGTGTTGAASTNTKVNATLDASGSVINRTLFPTGGPTGTPPSPFSGNNFRSSIATSGSTFYAVGTSSGAPNTGGAWFYDGSAFTQVSSTAAGQLTNMRNVEIYNDQLYVSAQSGSFVGISAVGSGLPTTAGQTTSLVIGVPSGSPYGFVMFSTGSQGPGVLDLAYVADDRAATGGGLQKWVLSSGSWSNAWSLLVAGTSSTALSGTAAAGFAGLRGLAGTWDAVNGASLYATTAEATSNNRLISILDTGLAPPSTYTTLQLAGANYVFRGVDLSPAVVPEPSAVALAGSACVVIATLWCRRRRRPDGVTL